MRLRSTYLFVVALAVIAVGMGFLGESAMAQSSQYKRPSKSSAPSVETNTEKQPSPTSVKKKSNKKSDEKVDISDLEDKYWMAKDTEFKVVQNRLYSKAGRFNLSAQFGSIINDGFSVGNILNLGVGYYFSERLGTEITYSHYMLKDSKMTSNFDSEFGATPDFNRFQSYVGASLQWVPIYAKLSFLDQQILYFDFVVAPGIGMLTYEQMTEDGGRTETSPVIHLDIAQQVYLSQYWALRLEMQNRYVTNEQVREYNHPDNITTTTQLSTSISFGFTFYFPDGKKGDSNGKE